MVAFVKLLGKTPLIVKDTPGFIVSRVSNPFFSEALRVFSENVADAAQIDRIMKLIGGFSFGPFEWMDQTGIDTALITAQSLYDQSFGEARFRPHPILKQMAESGLVGIKSGKGFYNYENTD